MSDRRLQQFDGDRMQGGRAIVPQAASPRLGVDARPEQRFVGIDVADPADEGLVEKQLLDLGVMGAEPLGESGAIDLEGIGTVGGRRLCQQMKASELPDIVVTEVPLLELEDGAGVRRRLGGPEEAAGHTELDEQPASIEREQQLLAVAAEGHHGAAGEEGRIVRGDAFGAEFRGDDPCALDMRPQAANDRFGFGKFRHRSLVEVEQDGAVFHLDAVFALFQRRVVVVLPGHAVEFPGMVRTNDHLAVERPLREGPEAVRADTVNCVQLPIDVTDSHPRLSADYLEHRPGGEFGQVTDTFERHTKIHTTMPSSLSRRALFAAIAVSAGCRNSPAKTIGVVPKGANHIFWKTVHAGAIKAAREGGYEVEWQAPTLEVDSARQIEIVESMVNRKLAGIVLAPVDRKALTGVVERAGLARIPVSIFDSAIDTKKILSYVATDNAEGGRLAARRMGELLQGKGKVAVIGFMPGSASTMERESGFQSEIETKFPGINIVGTQFGMASQSKSMAATENFLSAHPDLAGVFADNESSTDGAVRALQSRKARQVKLVGFDASDHLVGAMKEGWIDSLVVQNPFKMGYESTRAVCRHLAGEGVSPHIDSGVRIVLRSELEQPAVKELLFPDLKPWLG